MFSFFWHGCCSPQSMGVLESLCVLCPCPMLSCIIGSPVSLSMQHSTHALCVHCIAQCHGIATKWCLKREFSGRTLRHVLSELLVYFRVEIFSPWSLHMYLACLNVMICAYWMWCMLCVYILTNKASGFWVGVCCEWSFSGHRVLWKGFL
jgi:hypothetical protein